MARIGSAGSTRAVTTMDPEILVATWEDGVFALSNGSVKHERAGHAVRGLVRDGRGGAIAVLDGRSIERRDASGAWHAIARADTNLSCCVVDGDRIYVGSDDARVFRVTDRLEALVSFDGVEGREKWYAGTAVVGGKVVGPPLGVRSMTMTCDGRVLLANVHVGGIPRSTNRGASWQSTIDIEVDVHEVQAHPTRPELVIAAAGSGLCISRAAGATWKVETDGLHAPHCSAVAFAGDDILVSAAESPFAMEGAIYRRPIDGVGPLEPHDGLPRWIAGASDTACIAVRGNTIALADRQATIYLSSDLGRTWSTRTIPAGASSIAIL